MKEDTRYSTKDLTLAAFLLYNGYNLVEVDDSDKRSFSFVFASNPANPPIDNAVAIFVSDASFVEPKRFYKMTKYLKTVIYGGDKAGNYKRRAGDK